MLGQANNQDYTRFRSFAERYVIERAGTFECGYEQRDAWNAILDAKTIFGMIGNVDNSVGQPDTNAGQTTQSPTPQQAPMVGSIGQQAPMVGSIGGGPPTNNPEWLLAQAAKVYGEPSKIPFEIVNNIFKLFGHGKTNTP